MTIRAQLDAVATLLDEGAASSAVRMLRSAWEPELPTHDLIPLYCMWIRALCDTGDLDHAMTLAKRAAEELSEEPDILIALGNVHDLRGELPASRDAFRRALEVHATGALAHYNLGAVLERLGEPDEAEACYRRALEHDDQPGPMYESAAALGALLRRGGRLEAAALAYEQYLEQDPINVDILVEHGICLSDLDEFEHAVERFELAISLEPDHPGAWYNLAITLYRMGQPDDAMAAMDKARQSDPESPLTLAVLGSWYLAHGQVEANLDDALGMLYGALELLTESNMAEGLSPSYASLVFEEVFEALWQRGLRNEAREVARRAGQRDWITAHVLDTLNAADHGESPQVSAFTVTARVEAGEVPEYWPRDVLGYTRGLTVLAADEDEARHYSLEYLRTIEAPGVQFKIETVHPGADEIVYDHMVRPRARGVVGFASGRAYFR